MSKETLKALIKDLEKKYGEGAVLKINENTKRDIETIPTGSISLDDALGIGGLPRGRIIEIFGAESSGKTTLCLNTVAEAQKKKLVCAYIDAEHSFDIDYARNIGVDVSSLYISQPDSGEQALGIVQTFVDSGEFGLIVVDSVAALTPQAEIDGEMGQQFIGLQSRLMSQALRKLTAIASKTKTTIIFVNQIRANIGVKWGPTTTTPGGMALKFYCSVRIELKRAAKLMKGDDAIGNRVKLKVVKNKLSSPFKETEFDIMFGKGVSLGSDVVNFGIRLGVLTKEGSSIMFNKEKIGRGLESAKTFLEEKPELLQEIIKTIKEKNDIK